LGFVERIFLRRKFVDIFIFYPASACNLGENVGGKENFTAKLSYGLTDSLIDFSNEPAFLAVQSFSMPGARTLQATG